MGHIGNLRELHNSTSARIHSTVARTVRLHVHVVRCHSSNSIVVGALLFAKQCAASCCSRHEQHYSSTANSSSNDCKSEADHNITAKLATVLHDDSLPAQTVTICSLSIKLGKPSSSKPPHDHVQTCCGAHAL
eukprot:18158-Heterococcus_DN1.PRE.2